MAKLVQEEFDVVDFLQRKLEEIPASDVLIMATGAFLGYHGYTPITALINLVRGITINYAPTDISRAITAPLPVQTPGMTFVVNLLAGLAGTSMEAQQPAKEQIQDALLRAGIGLIEAYTLTRPGVLHAIAELVPL